MCSLPPDSFVGIGKNTGTLPPHSLVGSGKDSVFSLPFSRDARSYGQHDDNKCQHSPELWAVSMEMNFNMMRVLNETKHLWTVAFPCQWVSQTELGTEAIGMTLKVASWTYKVIWENFTTVQDDRIKIQKQYEREDWVIGGLLKHTGLVQHRTSWYLHAY